jgi:hypothetical protein
MLPIQRNDMCWRWQTCQLPGSNHYTLFTHTEIQERESKIILKLMWVRLFSHPGSIHTVPFIDLLPLGSKFTLLRVAPWRWSWTTPFSSGKWCDAPLSIEGAEGKGVRSCPLVSTVQLLLWVQETQGYTHCTPRAMATGLQPAVYHSLGGGGGGCSQPQSGELLPRLPSFKWLCLMWQPLARCATLISLLIKWN